MPTTTLTNSNDKFHGSIWNDIIFGNNGHDTIHGDWGYDQIYGGQGNDVLDGSLGNDLLMGQEGDDFLITSDSAEMHGGIGNDTYRIRYGEGQKPKLIEKAGEGTDTVILSVGNRGEFTLGAHLENLHVQTDLSRPWDHGAGAVLKLTANDLANEIRGGDGENVIDGRGGNDTIFGNLDRDVIHGGAGNDKIFGLRSSDTLYGDAGNDTIDGGSFDDVIRGGADNDVLYGGASESWAAYKGGNDTLYGDAGNDTIIGGDGADAMYGGTGDDTFHVDNKGDKVIEFAGQGTDTVETTLATLTLGAHVENLKNVGSSGIFTGYGNALGNRLTGGAQSDYMFGGDGNDMIYLGAGNDYGWGGNGDDFHYGQAGNNMISGGIGRDYLSGGTDKDDLRGDGGDDFLSGEAGNDRIVGGTGYDYAFGGSGADSFVFLSVADFKKDGYVSTRSSETIWDFGAGDKVDLSAIDANTALAGNQSFTYFGAGAPALNTAGALWTVDTGADLMVLGDINGDGWQDFGLLMVGLSSMSAADFVL